MQKFIQEHKNVWALSKVFGDVSEKILYREKD